ncbi:type VI secretion system-associated FHA domain protein [Polyangium jinanense]|uniref:FHA domain-containing protein n=1 Tax=Polyangium jinanense TaxID=2829994 RepID=A0A9X4AWQ0_9BACT|nr:type VI secretion system-associated FHA domain protein [Polyangium jinanense]MDC3956521.1 FHA domain-containing protein [Polyangium jinanense]MDC3985552.1 FHA domain-containing protein [Polyangium jinanense]
MPLALVARVIDTQANQSFDVTFERFPIRIGRNQLNDLHIDRPYVSQFHLAIDVRDRQIIVKDLGSTNGTVFAGRRLTRDTPTDVTSTPELTIGPIVMRMQLIDAAPKKREAPKDGTVLDFAQEQSGNAAASWRQQQKPITPGAEDAYVRQLQPYVEAYRAAWGGVYRVIYDHLPRLTPEVRQNYLKRVAMEQPTLTAEQDFQKLSQYYGVDPRMLGEPSPAQAAHAAMIELSRTLAPGSKPIEDVESVLTFGRKLRDAMEVFLKCFVSLRNGYQEFEAEMLAREVTPDENDRVASAKDEKELGNALLGPQGGPDAPRQLQDIFVDVMSHQVALINGVMEGVRTLLTKLSPKTIEEELERRGKRGGLFSNKFEALWKLYEVVHGDYAGEQKETFLIIFGPQFSRAYAATAGDDEKATGDAGAKNRGRFTLSPNQIKR